MTLLYRYQQAMTYTGEIPLKPWVPNHASFHGVGIFITKSGPGNSVNSFQTTEPGWLSSKGCLWIAHSGFYNYVSPQNHGAAYDGVIYANARIGYFYSPPEIGAAGLPADYWVSPEGSALRSLRGTNIVNSTAHYALIPLDAEFPILAGHHRLVVFAAAGANDTTDDYGVGILKPFNAHLTQQWTVEVRTD